jgi:hypothetical protein
MSHVFISYAREDAELVGRLHAALTARDRETWIDSKSIRPSEEWWARIRGGIEAAHAMVFVISPDSVDSRVCRDEFSHATTHNKRLIPVVARDVDVDAVPDPLRQLNWIFLRDGDDFEAGVERLVDALDSDFAWLDIHTSLLVKAREWENKGRGRPLLLRGSELVDAEKWLSSAAAHPKTVPTPLHTEYIAASREAEVRRKRILRSVSAAALFVVGVLSGASLYYNDLAAAQGKVAAEQRKVAAEQTKLADAQSRLAREQSERAQVNEQLAATNKKLADEAGRRAVLEAQAKQEQSTLRLIADANRILYSQPDQALIVSDEARRGAPTDASRLLAASTAQTALDIMTQRRDLAKRDSVQWGSEAIGGSVAPTWFRGRMSARLSPDGKRVLMTTERGRDGPEPPGDAYLLNYETLRLAKLVPPGRDGAYRRRLEYVGFERAGTRIYVARQYDIEIYDADGQFERVLSTGLGTTKYPIQAIEGWDQGKWLAFGDTDGQLVVLRPEANRGRVLARVPQTPVVEIRVSPSGRWLAALRRNGRVTLWRSGALDAGKPVQLDSGGIATIVFQPGDGVDALLTGGRDGNADLWTLAGTEPSRIRRFVHGQTALGYARFLEDGKRIVTIGDDQTTRIWDTRTGANVGRASAAEHVHWKALRTHRKLAFPPMAALPYTPAAIPLSDLGFNVRDVRDVGDRTWLLTHGRDAQALWSSGPAFRVDGTQASAFPDGKTSVSQIVGSASQTWLLTDGPAYRVRGSEVTTFPARNIAVRTVLLEGETAWLGTEEGVFRVRGSEVVRLTDETVAIRKLLRIGSDVWAVSPDGVFRLDEDGSLLVGEPGLNAAEMFRMSGELWVRTGTESAPGPMYRIEELESKAVPAADRVVTTLAELDGQIWIGTDKGAYRSDGRRTVALRGCGKRIARIEKHGARVFLLTQSGLLAGPACEVKGDAAVELDTGEGGVKSMWSVGNEIWLLSGSLMGRRDAYRLRGDEVTRFEIGQKHIAEVLQAGGSAWLLTEDGNAYRVADGGSVHLHVGESRIKRVVELSDRVFAYGETGAWRIQGDQTIPLLEGPAAVTEMRVIRGDVWLLATTGAYRIDGDRATRMTGPGLQPRRFADLGHETVILTSEASGPGPAYQVTSQGLAVLGDGAREVEDVRLAGGRLWLLSATAAGRRATPVIFEAPAAAGHASR